ncbi:MAG TPA: acyltransferase [Urbifossiella sp.]|nr:acyltransferase [Urbifossiella sp.]
MRYTNIQFLRVAAAVGVVLFHLGAHPPALVGLDPAPLRHPLLAGLPVPLFFAVSGFVLTHALRTTPPGRFLLARVLRLYPGYWLALAATAGLMGLGAFTEAHRQAVRLTGVNTLTLWPGGPGRVLYLLGVEWSLVYEVFLSVALAAFGVAGRVRAVPVLTGAWLAVLVAKMVVRPGLWFDLFPHWTTIALSPMAAPFLFGVLAYQFREAGRRWAWAIGPAAAGLLTLACTRPMDAEQLWVVFGLAAAGVVWLAVALPQARQENRLARLGDATYGLFLTHVPLMLAVLYPAARLGWGGRWEVVGLAGAVAIGGGLQFGRAEAALHARLRPLTRIDWSRAVRIRRTGLGRFPAAVAGRAGIPD